MLCPNGTVKPFLVSLVEPVAYLKSELLDPGSEFRIHHQWYLTTAMDALLGTDFFVAEKNRLYRCLDRVLEHKQDLFL